MTYDRFSEDAAAEKDDLRAQGRYDRQVAMRLARAPDCRDPDHPGCTHCEHYAYDDADIDGESEDD